jgi:hypothetical protein
MMPVPTAVLLKLINRYSTWAKGYVCGVLVNLTIFALDTCSMADRMEIPDLRPIKLLLAWNVFLMVCIIAVVCFRCLQMKKWIGLRTLFFSPDLSVMPSRKEVLILTAALLIYLIGACAYLYYVPDNAVAIMAEVNRLDYFGFVNDEPMVMAGYYLNKQWNVSVADAVCILLPLSVYPAVVALLWETAGSLFAEDSVKRSKCFLAEAVLLVGGDSLYMQAHFVLHGLNQLENILFVLCVPFAFAIGLQLYKEWDEGDYRKICHRWDIWFPLLLCIIISALFSQKVFALVGINIFIFALLFVGRRYLPWLRSSKL